LFFPLFFAQFPLRILEIAGTVYYYKFVRSFLHISLAMYNFAKIGKHIITTGLSQGEVNQMNKSELIAKVAEETGLSKKDATKSVDAVLDAIAGALKNGEKVQLVGFGNFEVRERSARKGRNPQTGEEIEIPASKVPAFKPGKALKDGIN
jgi:DNA-binding protein HU-beta